MFDYFDLIPDDVISYIFTIIDIEDIPNLCLSKTSFSVLIGKDCFWRGKYIHDYSPPLEDIISWKNAYRNFGKMFVFGNNDSGQLGLNNNLNRNIPVLLPFLSRKIRSVSCGNDSTMMIDLNNDVWAFGHNIFGKLGLGTDIKIVNKPMKISGIKAKSIVSGCLHTMIIDLDNNIWSCGNNIFGQLGLGNTISRNIPTQILLDDGRNLQAKSISCGFHHTMVIDLDDNLWGFGVNHSGQLGLGNEKRRYTPTLLRLSRYPSHDIVKVKSVYCGGNHTMVIDFNDNVWAFGHNCYNQLGLGDQGPNFVLTPTLIHNIKARSIACTECFTILVDLSNDVWLFGRNADISDERCIQIQHFKAKSALCGKGNIILIDLEDNVWTFGLNNYGQLELGDTNNRNVPEQILNVKVRSVACGQQHTILMLHPNSKIQS